jgi:hypothetical protein
MIVDGMRQRKSAGCDIASISLANGIITAELVMRHTKLAWVFFFLSFAGTALGQIGSGNYLPHKELIFPQVAAGGQYQTWVTVTNRGTQPWTGSLNFYAGEAQRTAWNPYVNGTQVQAGIRAVQVAAKATITFKITVQGDIQAGYLVIRNDNTALDNFLEGNLAYYISDDAVVTDSIGIMPSNPISASAIPFEDFSSLCFAFANTDPQARPSTMTMTLYGVDNAQVGTTVTKIMPQGTYFAKYLWQIFPAVPNTSWRGRLEIQSDAPISGVALTQTASGQFSSLPLGGTTRTYSISSSSAYVPFAKMTLWIDGVFVYGYALATSHPDLFALMGQIAPDGTLHVHFDGNSAATENVEISGYMKTSVPYTPGLISFSGVYYYGAVNQMYFEQGSYTATLVP